MSSPSSPRWHLFATLFIAGVWIFHGLYSKVLAGIPRHRSIVAAILGERFADVAVILIGILEILLGLWILSGIRRRLNALLQSLALITMNTLEILFAREFLLSATGMVFLNLCFIALIAWWALHPPQRISPHHPR